MIRKEYITEQNFQSKINKWKKQLFLYHKRWKKLDKRKSALLVIDMQNYFLDKKSHAFIPSGKFVMKNILKVIAECRKKNFPIIFTYFAVAKNENDPLGQWWKDTVYEGSAQSRIVKELKLRAQDIVIRKNSYSAFYKTDLENVLKKKNIKNVVIAGVLTNLCCETAAREAFVRNFNVFFLMDGTAAYNEEMHASALKNLSYGFATPITTREMLK